MTATGMQPFFRYLYERAWESDDGRKITDEDLKVYQWKWTGHYNTWIGRNWKSRKTKKS
jgi:hypothetical protein